MINPQHPRAVSLMTREKIVKGVSMGLTSLHGLIAQGRGEAFDYLLSERSHIFAKNAIQAAAISLLLARYPVLSINGNTAALVAKEFVVVAKLLCCPIEINLFHRTFTREKKIQKYLQTIGAKNVIGVGKNASIEIQRIKSKRKFVSPEGIQRADVVFVPLEDGDRTEELIRLGKKVITVDLNPLSRTAQKATITIVDNIVRSLPLLIKEIRRLQTKRKSELHAIITAYDNKEILLKAVAEIAKKNYFG
jgi:4-phosphopantoate--beta-alanine ligase